MQHYTNSVIAFNGDRVANATITVTDLSGNAVTIYQDYAGTTPLTSTTTNNNGEFDFYVPAGKYNITATGVGIAGYTISDEFIGIADSSVSPFIQSGTGAVSRYAQDKMREIVSVKDFGAVGDGVADDYAAIQATVTFATANNKSIEIPAGTYLCGNQVASSSGNVSIVGDGVGLSKIVFTATSGGFSFNLLSQAANRPPQQLNISKLTIESNAAVSSPAVSAEWSTYQANAQGSAWISDLNITRKKDGTGSFVNAIKLNKCVIAHVRNVIIVGDDNRVSDTAINLIDCIGIQLANIEANRYKTGASITKSVATQTEGVVFNSCTIYDVYRGVDANTAIAINIVNSHININGASADYCVKFYNVSQSFIGYGSLIYFGGNVSDPANQVAIRLEFGNSNIISNCELVGVTAANCLYAVHTISSGYNVVSTSNISSPTYGIYLQSGGQNQVYNCSFYNCATGNILNAGATDYVANNFQTSGTPAPINSIRWGSTVGGFNTGELSASASWGAYIKGFSGSAADVALASSGGKNIVCIQDAANAMFPGADNAYSIGTAARRWSVVYSATATINTSDERAKEQIKSLSDAQIEVAKALKGMIKQFKFKEGVAKKGDAARIHVGVIAQEVAQVFVDNGLNPEDYALFCHDQWDETPEVLDNEGNIIVAYEPAGDRYGIRYEELLAFIISAI